MGAQADARARAADVPSFEHDERTNLIRLSRRLVGGAKTLAPLKRMCDALGLCNDGSKTSLSNRIEAKLRELKFEENTAFVPTADDIKLNLDEFNSKFEDAQPHWLPAIEETLRGLIVLSP